MGKNKKVKKVVKPIIITKSDGWKADNLKVSYDDTLEIGKFNGSKLYGYINPDYEADPRWKNALISGFVKREFGCNGVKNLEKKLLELKINDGDRLYTNKVFKNVKGDFLASFDNDANHKKISKLLNATKALEIIEVSDYHIAQYDQNHYDIIGTGFNNDFDIYS